MKEFLIRLRLKHVVVSLVIGGAIAFLTLQDARAQPGSLFGDDYYCPASQHSCDFTGGTSPYFAPDPFDVGRNCDVEFLTYDGSTVDPNSCYGRCDHQYNTTGSVPLECYANCQSGADGQSGYAGCLRGAFGLGPRPQPISVDPRNTPRIAGNIFRSCLAGYVPAIHVDQYNSCIASGGTVETCCAEVASNYP